MDTSQKGEKVLVPLGQLVTTMGIEEAIREIPERYEQIKHAVYRHQHGDWGDMDAEDVRTNNEGLNTGIRLMSAYKQGVWRKIWVITEGDRSVTTVLFPEEY